MVEFCAYAGHCAEPALSQAVMRWCSVSWGMQGPSPLSQGPCWTGGLTIGYFTQERGKNAHSMPAARLPAFHFAMTYWRSLVT